MKKNYTPECTGLQKSEVIAHLITLNLPLQQAAYTLVETRLRHTVVHL